MRRFARTVGPQQRLTMKVERALQGFRQRRRAHRREEAVEQLCRIGAVPGAVAKPDGVVQALSGEVDAVVVGEDTYVNLRMAGAELL
jgi:hypothetical protein